ncbi:RAMP superfamily CRISPR-associated protein [Enterocloster aldenensis]|uniref:RAMP superfamily CRISPR-associated protein n=1 Tax=Enterocloster aldenensis TaxID=358742 RepID=UPI004027AFA2
MKRWWLEITLKSDMCAASGDSENGLLDIKTALQYGVPLIPGKRIKGSLLSEGKEMAENGFINPGILERLFGRSGSACPGNLLVRDAHIYRIPRSIFGFSEGQKDVVVDDYHEVLRELRNCPSLKEIQIEEILTRERTRTAIDRERGTAQNQMLRTMQIIPRGIVFRSLLEMRYPEVAGERETLEYCVKALRHMGLGITRGFGEIACTLKDTEEDISKYAPVTIMHFDNRMIELQYEIQLDTPVMFAGDAGLYEDCSSQIPGASIMGALAAMFIEDHALGNRAHEDENFHRIFLRDGVQIGYGFLKKEEKIFYPCPSFLAMTKDGGTKEDNGVINLLNKNSGLVRRKNIKKQICFNEEESVIFMAETEKEVRMHHKRPADRAIGHALNDRFEDGATDMGQFFQYTSLSCGQLFCGTIKGNPKDLSLLMECLEKRQGRFFLGRSRTAEYGEVRMRCWNMQDKKVATKKSKEWILWLLSPMLAIDWNNGDIRPKPEYLENQIEKTLDCKVGIREHMLRYIRVGGYNSKWRLPMPQYEAMAPGSVLLIQCEREISASELEGIRWGWGTGRGYGQVKALSGKMTEDMMEAYVLKDMEKENIYKNRENDLIRGLVESWERKEQVDREVHVAYEMLSKRGNLPNMTLITKLIRLVEEGDVCSYGEIMEAIQQIKDNKKKEAAEKLMEPCKNQSMEAIRIYLNNSKWKARREA